MNRNTDFHMNPGRSSWIIVITLAIWIQNAASSNDICECVGDTLDCSSRGGIPTPVNESLNMCNDEVTKLNISGSSMSILPNFGDRFTVIDASHCGLSKLPREMSEKLEVLVLSYNPLKIKKKSAINKLINLKTLKMDHMLRRVDFLDFLPSQCSLLHLDVSYNGFIDAYGIEGCKQLEWLDVSGNRLPFAESTLEGFDNLRYLGMRDMKMQKFPTKVFKLIPQLSELDISNNQLPAMKKEDFMLLPELRSLTINANDILTPDIFSELQLLIELHLRPNPNEKHTLPDGFISNMNNLEILDVNGCRLEATHIDELTTLTKLKKLDLSENQIFSIGETLSKMNNLEWLSLINNDMPDFKLNSVASLDKLETFKFTANNISEFPTGIFKELKNLKVLEIEARQLSDLQPDIFSELQQLEKLGIHQVNVKLPAEIFVNLASLKELDLSYSHFSEFSAGLLKGLVKLQNFEASDCDLSELPEDIFSDTENLKSLVLSMNKFTEMPLAALAKCASLVSLNMRKNSITSLPEYDTNIFQQSLSYIDMSENKIDKVPENILRSWLPPGKRMDLNLMKNGMNSPKAFRWVVEDPEVEIRRISFLTFIIQQGSGLITIDLSETSTPLMCGENPCEDPDWKKAAMFD